MPGPDENTVDQGVPINKLLEIIGKQAVEWIINEEVGVKVKEQYIAMASKLSTAMTELTALKGKQAESVPASPELEQLRKAYEQLQRVNLGDDERIKQLETLVHAVALERDSERTHGDKLNADSTALSQQLQETQEKYNAKVAELDAVNKKLTALVSVDAIGVPPIHLSKGKKR
jgi:uncharacterized coiled-coil DUF342 family protein